MSDKKDNQKKKKGRAPEKDAAADVAADGEEATSEEQEAAADAETNQSEADVSGIVMGAYKIVPLDKTGDYLPRGKREKKSELNFSEDPSRPEATDMFFGVLDTVEVLPKEQMDLQDAIGQVLTTVQKLYTDPDGNPKPLFRYYYVRLFHLARLGLEGKAMPDVAKAALDRTIDDLILAEGRPVKNMRLRKLGKAAGTFVAAFTLLYLIASFDILRAPLEHFSVDWRNARSFMILWTGTAIGVWLSYGIRKSQFTLRDLTVAEDDFLDPTMRVAFAGLLASFVGLVLMLDIVKIEIGPFVINDFATNPTIALFLGFILGINEIMLPASVAKRSKDLWDKIA